MPDSTRESLKEDSVMIKFSLRYFALPLVTVVIIGSLPVPTVAGGDSQGCGPAMSRTTDPVLRASFEKFERSQSAAAAKVCALYRNMR
jgi:hypothetical protein